MSRSVMFVAALIATLFVPVAASATQVAPVVSRTGLPDTFAYGGALSCDIGGGAQPPPASVTFKHVTGPATPPLGTGSIALHEPTGAEAAFGPTFTNAIDLAEFSFSYFVGTGLTGLRALIQVQINNTVNTLVATITNDTGWSSFDVLAPATSLAWYDASFELIGSGPYADYQSAHPGGLVSAAQLDFQACDSGPGTLNVDDLVVGTSTLASAYDFEPPIAASITTTASTPVVSGHPLTVTGTLTSNSNPLTNETVELWAKPSGETHFSMVDLSTTDSQGKAAVVQHPVVNTKYQWRFAGDDTYGATSSNPLAVPVASALTIHVAAAKIAKGNPLVAWGLETPVPAKSTVTIWLITGTAAAKKLGTAHVQSDGTWGFAALLAKGTHKVYATSPATTANATGISRRLSVTQR